MRPRTPVTEGQVSASVATFLLLHGAASSGWYWHLVEPLLAAAGHNTVAPDLPADDPTAGLRTYATAAVDALDGHCEGDLVVVAQSMAGFYAPLVAEAIGADRLVLLAAMIPNPGERGHDWWANTDQPTAQRARFVELGLDTADMDNPDVVYGHDIPRDVWVEAGRRTRDQSGRPFDDPCPITSWPAIPTHVIAARDDRLFPLEFQQRVAMDRLGLDVEVVPGGHLPALSQPQAVADALLRVVR